MCTLLHNQGALGMSIQIWCLTWESKMHVWVPKVYSLKVSWELEVVLTPKAPWPRYAKPVGHMWPRTAMNVVKQRIMRSLKLLWDFFCVCDFLVAQLHTSWVWTRQVTRWHFDVRRLGSPTLGLCLEQTWTKTAFAKRLSWTPQVL